MLTFLIGFVVGLAVATVCAMILAERQRIIIERRTSRLRKGKSYVR
jgi:hypothetical protein